jgi:CBS domain containing-hemolysin-like protein
VEIILIIIGVAGAITFAGFYSGIETAGYSSSKIKLRCLASAGNLQAKIALMMLDNISAMITLALIGHNLGVYLGTYIMESYFTRLGYKYSELWATIALTPFFFIFAEVSPKQIGHIISEKFCMAGARLMKISSFIYWPLLAATPDKTTVREEVIAHVAFGTASGVLNKTQHTVANHIMTIESRPVNKVMTLFENLVSAKKTSTCAEILSMMQEHSVKYIPIVNKNKQKIYGFVSLSSILKNRIPENKNAEEFMETGAVIDHNSSIGHALSKLQQARVKVGVVIDGEKSLGIVTIKALIWHLVDKNI